MLTSGVVLDDFNENPLMLFNHIRPKGNSTDQLLPIGNWVDLAVEGDNIWATPFFDDGDEFAMKIYNKVEAGFLKMCSAGAEPIEVSIEEADLLPGQERPTVTKWKLKEASICDIGSNPDSLGVALYDHDFNTIHLSEETYDKLFPIIQKSKMKTKPTTAQIAAAKKTVELADKSKSTFIASKAPKAADLAAAKALLKLADDPAADDEPDADVDLNADPADLDDDQKVALILALQKALADSTQKLADMDEQQQLADEQAQEEKCVSLADTAVKMRKITLSQKDMYIRLAKADFEGTKQVLDAMKAPATIKSQLEQGGGGGAVADEKLVKLAAKSYDELFRSGELPYLLKNDTETYKLKLREKFGKDPKNV
jgi:hypothetical protein